MENSYGFRYNRSTMKDFAGATPPPPAEGAGRVAGRVPADHTGPIPSKQPSGPQKFGTFSGVFTPSILTILGVVMYMRLGWVTGQAGLFNTMVIIVVAHLISLATGLSVSSISTNRTVGTGGAYFMISRALGAPTGAAIGLPLFFAQSLSVTFYIVGFVESVQQLLPWIPSTLVATVINVLLTLISLKSTDLALKVQYFVMGGIVISLVSFFTGTTDTFPRPVEWTNPTGAAFGDVFAVFFPAVTGIMAGVSMSGDLQNPRKSIPRGTLLAIAVGFVVYMAVPVWLAFNFSNGDLIEKTDAVFLTASIPALIYVGVWGATLSSALGSILTAPRTLQALAMDGLAPAILARGYGVNNEPRGGIILTFVLAQVGIFLGSLDAIAPVLTMFFLSTYGLTNLASGLERWASSPSFRPTFRTPVWVSLTTAVACFYVMSIIDMVAMAAAIGFSLMIFFLVQRRNLDTTYGDARHGIWAALVRAALQRLRRADFHPQNWRPNLIILGGNPRKRPHLLHLGNCIVQDRGVVTYFHLVEGCVQELASTRKSLMENFDPVIADKFPNVFYRVDIVPEIYRGTVQTAQSYGLGSFETNSVMVGWPKKPERANNYVNMLRDLATLDRSLLLVSHNQDKGFGTGQQIHVWWGGLRGNGGLMLLIAFLITAHHQWRGANITLLTITENEEKQSAGERKLKKLLQSARIGAHTRVIRRDGQSLAHIMHRESASADLAIVGFALPKPDRDPTAFHQRMNEIVEGLPTTLLVHSARNFDSNPVLFDELDEPTGTTTETAAATTDAT